MNYKGFFLFPSFIFEEIKYHSKELMSKSQLSRNEYVNLVSSLMKKMMIVETDSLVPYRAEALGIVKDIDKNDVIFFACALAYAEAVIWGDDKRLKKQSKIRIINTKEIMVHLNIN